MRRLVLLAAAILGTSLLAWLLASRSDDAPAPDAEPEQARPAEATPGLRGAGGARPTRHTTTKKKTDAASSPAEDDTDEGPRTATVKVIGPDGPLKDARVELTFRSGTRTRVALSDARGIVMFGFGEQGYVGVDVRLRGFRPADEELELSELAHKGKGPYAEVMLEPGVPLSGRIVDAETGEPIRGALVGVNDWDRELEVSPTMADGRFSHPGIRREGETHLVVMAEGYVEAEVTLQADSGRITPRAPEIGLVAAGQIVGRVLTPDGAPAADAGVVAEPDDGFASMSEAEEAAAIIAWRQRYPFAGALEPLVGTGRLRADTDAHGRYVLKGVAPGQPYTLRAFEEDFAPSALHEGVQGPDGGQSIEVDLTLRIGAELTILVRTADAVALPNDFRVRLIRRDDDSETSVANPGARAVFRNLAPGDYVIYADPDGFLRLEEEVTVTAGVGQEVKLLLDEGASVEGTVVDEHGKPVAGANVQAFPVKGNTDRRQRGLVNAQHAKTNARGTFRIAGLLPGASLVTADLSRHDGGLCTRERVALTAPARGLRLTVLPRARIRARLLRPDGSLFTGELDFVLHDEGGRGGETVWRGGGPWDIERGALLINDVNAGRRTLMLAPEGFAWLRRAVTVEEGVTLDLGDIRLHDGVTLAGRVIDRDGIPIAGVLMQCTENHKRVMRSDANGQFHLERFPAGAVGFDFWAEGFVYHWQTLAATPGGVTVRMQRPALTRGSVSLPGGTVPPESSIHLRPFGAKGIEVKRKDKTGKPTTRMFYEDAESLELTESGAIVEAGLRPGRYVAWLKSPGAEDRRLGEVTLVEGESNELRFTLPK